MKKIIFSMLLFCCLQADANILMQYIFKPIGDINSIFSVEEVKEAAQIWMKHGAEVSVWQSKAGDDVGSMVMAIRFTNFRSYQRVADEVMADPDYLNWKNKVENSKIIMLGNGNLLSLIPKDH